MELPNDVQVYKMGFKTEVYRAATQYQACLSSIAKLEDEMQTKEYGEGYRRLLASRIAKCKRDIAELDRKYGNLSVEDIKGLMQ